MSNHLPTPYQQLIHQSRYARWLDDEQRRETWSETVGRYFDFMTEHLEENNGYTLEPSLRSELEDAVLSLQIMPSMRALMTAGPAAKRDNVATYNCSYCPIDNVRAFDEILYVLMCGTGVGFSVERKFTDQLPVVNEHFEKSSTVLVVEDSKAGWARSLRELLAMLYAGQIPSWDVSKVRPAGARLKTFGGRASGPEPLVELFEYAVRLFRTAAGRRLTSLECHDLVCKIAQIVVVGGVRRSALISLSDLSDDRIRHAKSGAWYESNPERALANNSVAYTSKPDTGSFLREWTALYESKSGERGIFSRDASIRQAALNGRRVIGYDADGNPLTVIPTDKKGVSFIQFGTNPCSEIILRPYQFCNLTEVVVRANDGRGELTEKVHLSSILGTFQSTLTNFKYLRKIWTRNTEEERLLGVSLTGILDNPILNDADSPDLPDLLQHLRAIAVVANGTYADRIGIPVSAAITCVKPSGTVSQLVDAASGIHARHSPYYIRRIRGDKKDPLTKFLIDAGVPAHDDVYGNGHTTTVFEFPMKAPEGAVTRHDMSAIEHLKLWLLYQTHWCEHKPSITVSVRESEWPAVGAWVYDHFDVISGISFLPMSEHTYKLAPYEDCTKDQFDALAMKMPVIDWQRLQEFEREDSTTSSQELACVAGACDITDLTNSK